MSENLGSYFWKEPKNRQTKSTQIQKATEGKTFFSFSEKENLFLKADEKNSITVLVSPQYEAVISAQVKLLYDQNRVEISDIHSSLAAVAIDMFVDSKKGQVSFIAAFPHGLFGKDIPLFSFDVRGISNAEKGETLVRIDMASPHALLPDADNTDTSAGENPPILVLSLL